MSWISLALALLKFVNALMDFAKEQRLIQQGHDQAIAEVAQEIMRKTSAGRAILDKVNRMSDAEVDDGLRGLEPR